MRWLAILAVVVANALVQTFVGSVWVGAVALLVGVWLVAVLAGAPRARAAVGTLGTAVVAVVAALLSPLLVPVVLVAGVPVLTGTRPRVWLTLGGLLLAALSWVAAILVGFFVSGWVAGLAIWLWCGLLAAFLLRTAARHRT